MMKQFRFKTMMSMLALIAAIFSTSISAYAQDVKNVSAAQRTITGKVVDQNGDPVIGAMVVLVGTSNGAATDFDGKYSLTIKQDNASLEFSSIGYETVKVSLNDHQVIADVVMPTEAVKLDDVVVIGYGVQNKRDVTTSITSIKADDFKKQSSADFRDAMAARMPGVQVLTLGGQPDGNIAIRVRGIQSATAGNDPLYVIDGVPCDSRAFANLDGSDIESLEVLKDASAAAIYGSRGSCGVVLITTKRGSSETPVVSYDGQVSISNVNKRIEMLDAYEWSEIYIEARNGAYTFNVPTGSFGDPMSA
jgi:TonB-dependent SusC/RagA subfamily outer membrane receptor